MFLFVDGVPVVLDFDRVEFSFYKAFITRFPEANVSISQWRGSYEYQIAYAAIQLQVENGEMTLEALDEVLGSIAKENEQIKRPAVLHSRVSERFAELGFEATLRVPDINTRGIVAICIDAPPASSELVATTIRDELWPAGQFLEGDIEYPTAISNGQPVTIRWTTPIEGNANFRVTITRARGSQYPIETVEEITGKFMTNYSAQMGIGSDITPATYLTTVDLPWAAAVAVEYDELGGEAWATSVHTSAFNQRYAAKLEPANVVIL